MERGNSVSCGFPLLCSLLMVLPPCEMLRITAKNIIVSFFVIVIISQLRGKSGPIFQWWYSVYYMPTDMPANSLRKGALKEVLCMQIVYKVWDFRLHLGYKMSASTYKNVAKTQVPVTLTFLAKVGFKQLSSGLNRFVTIGRSSETGLLWGARRGKK